MLTTCPAAARAGSGAGHATDDTALDSAPPDPARDAKPVGTPGYKNAGMSAWD
jgi:hypothetical protein